MTKSMFTYVGLLVLGAAGCAESTQSGTGTDTQTQALSAEGGPGEGRRHHGPPPDLLDMRYDQTLSIQPGGNPA